MHPTFCSLQSGWNLVFWCLTFRVHPTFCSLIFRVHPTFWSLKFVVHPIFCSIQDAPCIQFYNIESAPLICLNIQGASSIEHTIYGHVLGHKGGARAPSAPWLDPPLINMTWAWTNRTSPPMEKGWVDAKLIWVFALRSLILLVLLCRSSYSANNESSMMVTFHENKELLCLRRVVSLKIELNGVEFLKVLIVNCFHAYDQIDT